MLGLMQDYPLTMQHILWRMEKLFSRKEVVTKRADGIHRYTYGDFTVRARRLANALQRIGVRPGDRIATLAWNNYRHLELYYATPCMGAVLHTLNLRLFTDQLEYVINDAADRIVCVDQSLVPVLNSVAGKLPTVERVIILRDPGEPAPAPLDPRFGEAFDYESLLADADESFAWPDLDERSAAGMCYTSGTTGMPKGVVYSHRSNFLHTMSLLQRGSLELAEEDVILPVVPLFHANAWGIPFACGMSGAGLVFPDRWMGDAQTLIDLVNSENVTVLAGVPTIWMNLVERLESTAARLPSVNRVICGGSAVPPALMRRFDAQALPLLHAWGMTETSPVGTLAFPRSWHAASELPRVRLMQGSPSPCVEMRINDIVDGAELPWDGVAFGELQVRGPWVAAAYHGNVDADRFTSDGWFRTGDVASIDRDGFMQIVDRTKDVVKSGGEWISSVELENQIMNHAGVMEAAVIGLPHPTWIERPVGFVVPRPEFRDTLTEAAILEFLSDKVSKWWLPDEIRFVDALPKTSVGKFDKKVLRAKADPIRVTEP